MCANKICIWNQIRFHKTCNYLETSFSYKLWQLLERYFSLLNLPRRKHSMEPVFSLGKYNKALERGTELSASNVNSLDLPWMKGVFESFLFTALAFNEIEFQALSWKRNFLLVMKIIRSRLKRMMEACGSLRRTLFQVLKSGKNISVASGSQKISIMFSIKEKKKHILKAFKLWCRKI